MVVQVPGWCRNHHPGAAYDADLTARRDVSEGPRASPSSRLRGYAPLVQSSWDDRVGRCWVELGDKEPALLVLLMTALASTFVVELIPAQRRRRGRLMNISISLIKAALLIIGGFATNVTAAAVPG